MAEGAKPHAPAIIPGLETFPRLLRHHARVRADRPAIRERLARYAKTQTQV